MFKLLVLILLMATAVLLFARGMPQDGMTPEFALARTQPIATAFRWTSAGVGRTMTGLQSLLGRSGCSGGWNYRT